MNVILIILIVIIILITLFFEYMLILNKVYPWDIFKASSWTSIWNPWTQWNWKKWPPWSSPPPPLDTDLPSDSQMCSLENLGTIQDYSGGIINNKKQVRCNNCINYLSQSTLGCTQLTFSKNTCIKNGDYRICPIQKSSMSNKTGPPSASILP